MTAGIEWIDVDPYVARHLPEHAAAGQALDDYVTDSGFLAIADPSRLLPALRWLMTPEARRVAAIYRRAADQLYGATTVEHMALLHMTAWMEDPGLASRLAPLVEPAWRCLWASWEATAVHSLLSGHTSDIKAIATGSVQGESLIASADAETTHLWTADSAQQRGVLANHKKEPVVALAFGEVDGEPVLLVACGSGALKVVAIRTNEPYMASLHHDAALQAVQYAVLDGEPVAIAGGQDGAVLVWSLRTGRQLVPTMKAGGSVASLDVTRVDGRVLIATGGQDGLRAWDGGSGELMWAGRVPLAHDRPRVRGRRHHKERLEYEHARANLIQSVAFDRYQPSTVVVSLGHDSVVRTWDRESGSAVDSVALEHAGPFWEEAYEKPPILASAFGHLEGEPVVVGGGTEGLLQAWNSRTGKPLREHYRGYRTGATAIALARIGNDEVIVTGGADTTVRIFETNVRRASPRAVEGHEGHVNCVALGEVEGRPVAVSGGGYPEGDLRLSDADTGEGLMVPISLKGYAEWVAISDDGAPSPGIAYGAESKIWTLDPRTGRATQEPDLPSAIMFGTLGTFARLEGERVLICAPGWNEIGVFAMPSAAVRTMITRKGARLTALGIGAIHGDPVIAAGDDEGELSVWHAISGEQHGSSWKAHEGGVGGVTFGEVDGAAVMVTGGADGALRVWTPRGTEWAAEEHRAHAEGVTCLAVSASNPGVIASGGGDGDVHLTELGTRRRLTRIATRSPVLDIAVRGDRLAIATERGVMVVANAARGVPGRRA